MSLMNIIKKGIFFALMLTIVGGNSFALDITNKSGNQAAVAVLKKQNDKNLPVYLKIVEPGKTVAVDVKIKGPFIVSVADMVTKETMRLEDVSIKKKVVYDGAVVRFK